MITTLSFVKNILPAGKIPGHLIDHSDLSDLFVAIPFAVMGWDNGLDYNEDGSSYQDYPPHDYVAGAFETRNEAEAFIASTSGKYNIVENYHEPLWSFNHVYWQGLNSREEYLAMCLTSEDVAQLEGRLVREEVQTPYNRYTKVSLAG